MKISPEEFRQAKEAAEAANPEDKAEAIRAIADLKDQRGVPLMTELLTYKQPSVRAAAARGLFYTMTHGTAGRA